MKSYTDLEQSKKLAEFLPLESADMFYYKDAVTKEDNPRVMDYSQVPKIKSMYYFPCWSLTALLDILPTTIGNLFEKNALRLRMDKAENNFNIWYDNFDCGDVAEGLDVIEPNPVDACYEMILKLNEQKLLGVWKIITCTSLKEVMGK